MRQRFDLPTGHRSRLLLAQPNRKGIERCKILIALVLISVCASFFLLRWTGDQSASSRAKHRLQQVSQLVHLKQKHHLSERPRAVLTVHAFAGTDCSLLWIRHGKWCNITAYSEAPLDFAWVWHNASELHYNQAKKEIAKKTFEDLSTPSMIDTLQYSLRSAEKFLPQSGRRLSILTNDVEVQPISSSISHSDPPTKGHSFTLLRHLSDLIRFRSSITSTLRSTKGLLTSHPLSHNPIGYHFKDEAGKMRFAQSPRWLESGFHDSGRLQQKSLWSIACPIALPTEEVRDIQSALTGNSLRDQNHQQNRKKIHDLSWTVIASYACKQRRLPTFNPIVARSIALNLESQSNAFVLMEPHYFFGANVSSSDFYSPLYGPVFRLSSNGVGSGERSKREAPNAEVRAQVSANTLLGNRFGQRDRFQLQNLPKIVVKDLVQETTSIWRRELKDASLARVSDIRDVDLLFLYSHYTIERHREALLWSFLVARHDVNGDDLYSQKEISHMLSELGLTMQTLPKEDTPLQVFVPPWKPREVTTQEYRDVHRSAGFQVPTISDVAFTSLRGPQAARISESQTPEACRLVAACFTPLLTAPVKASAYFKHVTSGHWGCGDCIITILHQRATSNIENSKSDSGLAPFLPTSDLHFPAVTNLFATESKPQLPLVSHPETADFSLSSVARSANYGSRSRLEFIVQVLLRYQYVIAHTENRHASTIFNDESPVRSLLNGIRSSKVPIFSFESRAQTRRCKTDSILSTWLSERYPQQGPYEKTERSRMAHQAEYAN